VIDEADLEDEESDESDLKVESISELEDSIFSESDEDSKPNSLKPHTPPN
jgi:hypothetical protein